MSTANFMLGKYNAKNLKEYSNKMILTLHNSHPILTYVTNIERKNPKLPVT